MNAPCSHCEQISTRGSDAVVAPICPQFGQTIRVSMNVTTAGADAPSYAVRCHDRDVMQRITRPLSRLMRHLSSVTTGVC